MSILEKIKLALLYDGLTKKEYLSVEPYIIKENNRRLRIYNVIGLIFVLVLFFISIYNSGFSSKTFVYLGSLLCNVIIIILLSRKTKYNKILSKIIDYFFTSLMLFFTIYVGTIKSEGLPATTFFAALALIPYITYDKVIYSFIHRLIILALFIALSFATKQPEYVHSDIINGVAVFVLSTLAGVRVQKMQVNSWVMTNNMDKELTKMSGIFECIREIDLTSNSALDYSTTMQNENRIVDSTSNATKQMDSYIEEFVSENNKVHMRQFCDLSTLEDRLYNEKILICDYGTKDVTWRRATFVAIEEDSKGFPTKVVFTIQRIADSFYLNMLDFNLEKIK